MLRYWMDKKERKLWYCVTENFQKFLSQLQVFKCDLSSFMEFSYHALSSGPVQFYLTWSLMEKSMIEVI